MLILNVFTVPNCLPDLEFWTPFPSSWIEGPQRLCALLCLLCGQHPVGDWRWQWGNQGRVFAMWSTAAFVAWAKPPAPHWGPLFKGLGSTGFWMDGFFVFFCARFVHSCTLQQREFILERSISYACEEADALVICIWFSAVILRMSHLNSWTWTKGCF